MNTIPDHVLKKRRAGTQLVPEKKTADRTPAKIVPAPEPKQDTIRVKDSRPCDD